MQVMPENPKVVHHVLVYTIQDAQSVGQVQRAAGGAARGGRNANNVAAAAGSASRRPRCSSSTHAADGDIFRDGSAKMLQARRRSGSASTITRTARRRSPARKPDRISSSRRVTSRST
jgi:hypothetical protein